MHADLHARSGRLHVQARDVCRFAYASHACRHQVTGEQQQQGVGAQVKQPHTAVELTYIFIYNPNLNPSTRTCSLQQQHSQMEKQCFHAHVQECTNVCNDFVQLHGFVIVFMSHKVTGVVRRDPQDQDPRITENAPILTSESTAARPPCAPAPCKMAASQCCDEVTLRLPKARKRRAAQSTPM